MECSKNAVCAVVKCLFMSAFGFYGGQWVNVFCFSLFFFRGYHNYQARGAGTSVNRTRINTVDEEQDSDDDKQTDAGYRKSWKESTTTVPQVLDVKIGWACM